MEKNEFPINNFLLPTGHIFATTEPLRFESGKMIPTDGEIIMPSGKAIFAKNVNFEVNSIIAAWNSRN